MTYPQNSISWSPPKVIGHRGACGHAPENTLASIRKAHALGATWVEFDVRLSRDGVPMLMHDLKPKRTTGHNDVIAQLDFDALRELDAGSWFDASFADERIPTLAEAIAELSALGLGANVEIKPVDENVEQTATVIAQQLRTHWSSQLPPPLISSFCEPILEAFQEIAPEMDRTLLVTKIPRNWEKKVRNLGCVALHCEHSQLTPELAAEVKSSGCALRCYTVNDPDKAIRLLRWGVSSVVSDFPDRILSRLAGDNA